MFVYKITNNINGKIYIGKTVSTVEDRFRRHVYSCRISTTHLHTAMRKYGPENFSVVAIDQATDKVHLCERECFWIRELQPDYNLTIGGEGGDTFAGYTDEQRTVRRLNHSTATKLMWENLSAEERSRRGRKTQSNTNQKEKGAKISAHRKELFANETDEQKIQRSAKAKMGAHKIQRINCVHCNRLIHPGNIRRHETSCVNHTIKTPKQRYNYTMISADGEVVSTTCFRRFCKDNRLSPHVLIKNIGRQITQLARGSSNITETTLNTIGWTLVEVIPLLQAV